MRKETIWYVFFLYHQVLKCLLQFVQNFPSLTEAHFSGKCIFFPLFYPVYSMFFLSGKLTSSFGPVIVAPLWQTFVSSLEVYQLSSIEGSKDSHSGRYDSDGVEQSLESFVIQVIVSFGEQALILSSRYRNDDTNSYVGH